MARDLLSNAARHLVREVRRVNGAIDTLGSDVIGRAVEPLGLVAALAQLQTDLSVALRVYLNAEGGQRAEVAGQALVVPMWYEVLCPDCQTPLPSPESGMQREVWDIAEVVNNRAVWCETCGVNVPLGGVR